MSIVEQALLHGGLQRVTNVCDDILQLIGAFPSARYHSSAKTTAQSPLALSAYNKPSQHPSTLLKTINARVSAQGTALTLFIRRELEPSLLYEREQLLVRRGLAELAIGLGCVKAVFAGEANGLNDCIRGLLNRHLLILAHGEDKRLDRIIVAQHPHEELGEIARVDELP